MTNKEEYNNLLNKAIDLAYNKGLNYKVFRLTKNGEYADSMVFQYIGDCFFVGIDVLNDGIIRNRHTIQENTYSVLNKNILKVICAFLKSDNFVVLS